MSSPLPAAQTDSLGVEPTLHPKAGGVWWRPMGKKSFGTQKLSQAAFSSSSAMLLEARAPSFASRYISVMLPLLLIPSWTEQLLPIVADRLPIDCLSIADRYGPGPAPRHVLGPV